MAIENTEDYFKEEIKIGDEVIEVSETGSGEKGKKELAKTGIFGKITEIVYVLGYGYVRLNSYPQLFNAKSVTTQTRFNEHQKAEKE